MSPGYIFHALERQTARIVALARWGRGEGAQKVKMLRGEKKKKKSPASSKRVLRVSKAGFQQCSLCKESEASVCQYSSARGSARPVWGISRLL